MRTCVYMNATLNVDAILIPSVQSCLLGITKEMEMRCKSLEAMNRNYELTTSHILLSISGTSLQVLRIITFSIAPSKLQYTFSRDFMFMTLFSAIIFPSNYSHENLAIPYRICLLVSPFTFSRPTEPDLVARPPLIFILKVTSENVLRQDTFIFLLRREAVSQGGRGLLGLKLHRRMQ